VTNLKIFLKLKFSCEKIAQNVAQRIICPKDCISYSKVKVEEKLALLCNKKSVQNQQSTNWLKCAQSGHPCAI
jgi:hypothetical protein